MSESPIIIALDFESANHARALVHRLGDTADFYKIGMELYAAEGMDFVRELVGQGKQVFLDMKYHDIHETVKRAVAQVAKVGVRFLTIHSSKRVMRAAVEGRGDDKLQLLAVTVLTDLGDSDLSDDGYAMRVPELVELRVRNAREVGIDGIVCSPLEVAKVRSIAGPEAVLVTPGVRSAGASAGDQKRVATPAEAVANGADYLVVGRQVTRAAEPAAEYARVLSEIRSRAR